MWTRADLKKTAKEKLKGRYWLAFVTSLIFGLISGELLSGGMSIRRDHNTANMQQIRDYFAQHTDIFVLILFIAIIIFLIAAVIGICYRVFITHPILVGHKRYYLENRDQKSEVGRLFSLFAPGYKNVVKVMFRKYLSIFLWSLLFIIPGIIKSLQYFTVEYILAENPMISYQDAIKLSKEMTNNQKWNIVVLYLSFIGWAILCLFTFGIGFLFLSPYIEATMAELYVVLKEKQTTPA